MSVTVRSESAPATTQWSAVPRWWKLMIAAVAIAAVYAAIGAGKAWSQTSSPVIQVEEDWELVVSDPDSGNTAPQITCTMSPYSHLNNLHAVVEINHKTSSYWVPGGINLQTWAGDYNLTRKSIESSARLSTPGETVTWTTKMKVFNNALSFSIANGNSTTWGTFGGGTTLYSAYGTSLTNLSGYSPEYSVANSGIGFASNRVQSLVLKRVRYTTADGQVTTDETERAVHQLTE